MKTRLMVLVLVMAMFALMAAQQPSSRSHMEQLAKTSRAFYETERQNFIRNFPALQKTMLPDSADYDQYYYDLNWTVSTSPNNLEGAVTGKFRSRINGLSQIKLNFDSREGTSPWQNLSVSGDVSSWNLSNWVLRVNLDQSYNAGDTFSVTVHYAGVPRGGGFQGFSFDTNAYGDPVISSLSEPYLAQTWWPCKDDPADKLDSADIHVTVPGNMMVASNGLLQSVTDNGNGTKTFYWKERYPITTYLISVAISNYATFSDSFEYSPGNFMPIDYFVYPQQLTTAQAAFQPLPAMLQAYSNLYGLYPFINEKYGHAVFEWGGAMEHQTCTSIGHVTPGWESIYAHELSHQWFGDLITCHDWHDIWMNEGFATYSEALWAEAAYGKQAYHDYVNSTLSSLGYWATDPVYRYDITDPGYIFSYTVYAKGMWVLHMLRHLVGDSTFFTIMHDYPQDPAFRFKDVTTEQFRDFCEMKSGMDLHWFFDEWVYKVAYPTYEWGWNKYQNGSQHYLYLKIYQKPVSLNGHGQVPLYKMPIDLAILYTDGTRDTVTVWDSLRTQYYDIPVPKTPLQVQFDPDNWVLKEASQVSVTAIAPPVNLAGTFVLYPNFPNPFNSTTHIPFSLDTSGHVRLDIYDVTGRRVRRLLDENLTQGDIVEWDGTDDAGNPVASGLYIYRIQFNSREVSRKMLLVR